MLDQWKVVFARLKGAKSWERLTVWLMIPGKTQRGLYTQIDTLKEFFFFKANERMNGENAKAKAIRTVLEIDSVIVVFWRHEKSDLEIFDVWIEASLHRESKRAEGKYKWNKTGNKSPEENSFSLASLLFSSGCCVEAGGTVLCVVCRNKSLTTILQSAIQQQHRVADSSQPQRQQDRKQIISYPSLLHTKASLYIPASPAGRLSRFYTHFIYFYSLNCNCLTFNLRFKRHLFESSSLLSSDSSIHIKLTFRWIMMEFPKKKSRAEIKMVLLLRCGEMKKRKS